MSQEINLPIPTYPPFTLRSSLIDKDPVIWVHLLEGYVKLFQFLADGNFQYLTIKSKQQLYQFLKSYLFETFDEENKIFSLGAINVDIQKNEAELKKMVFNAIRLYSLLKFNLIGESIWYFIGIYVNKNHTVVRGLVDGSFKSKLNDNKKSGNISSIGSVHSHLEKLILNGKFTEKDLTTLSVLLGQSISTKTIVNLNSGKSDRVVNKKKSIEFAEKFVNSEWVDILEKAYANGRGLHAGVAKNAMIVSLISLPATQISKLVKSKDITKPSMMILSPLLCSIVISPEFGDLIVGTEEKLGFLIPDVLDMQPEDSFAGEEPFPEGLDNLISIFPDLTPDKAKAVLQQNENDVEHVINMLLENPGLIDDIKVSKPQPKPVSTPKVKITSEQVSRFKSDNQEFGAFKRKNRHENINVSELDDRLKQATMALAMSSLEDEEEADPEIYTQFEKYFDTKKPGSKNTDPSTEPLKSNNNDYLYAVYQSEGIRPFEADCRGKSIRKYMKEHTGWSDNLIEDWGKMLTLSNEKHGIPADIKTNNDKSKSKPQDKNAKKANYHYNDKNKAQKANHNRKSQHNKKSKLETAGL